MLTEAFAALPPWVVAGLGLGAAASVVVAGLFVAGERLFPTQHARGRRVDGNARRRAEIRAYLRDIGEPFVEDRRVHGERVAFYLPDRDVAITFDAHAFFGLTGTDTVAVLCEAEMPGSQVGRRLPFDVPDGRGHPEVSPSVAAAFDRLDLSPDADPDAVRAAYRSRVKEVHPDQGGDEQAFKRVREAYALASTHASAEN